MLVRPFVASLNSLEVPSVRISPEQALGASSGSSSVTG